MRIRALSALHQVPLARKIEEVDRRLAHNTNGTDLQYAAGDVTPLKSTPLKIVMFINLWLRHVPVNLKGSQITKGASLKSGAVKVELTVIIGEMSVAAALISPTVCEYLIYSFVSFATASVV